MNQFFNDEEQAVIDILNKYPLEKRMEILKQSISGAEEESSRKMLEGILLRLNQKT